MDENMCKVCSECELEFTEFCPRFNCRGCGRWVCGSCVRRSGSLIILATTDSTGNGCHLKKVMKSCKFCFRASRRYTEKIHPSESPRGSPEPPSPSSDGDKICDDRNAKRIDGTDEEGKNNIPSNTISKSRSFSSSSVHTSPVFVCGSPTRSDEETEDCEKPLFSPSSEYDHDSSDPDTAGFSLRHEHCNGGSEESSPTDSPSRINGNPLKLEHYVHHEKVGNQNFQNGGPSNPEMLVEPAQESRDLEHADGSNYDTQMLHNEKKFKKQLDFENNDNIWLPPPPEDENDDTEISYFGYDDDDDEIGDTGGMFSSKGGASNLFSDNEKQSEEQRKPLKSMIHNHFRVLVSELLQGEGINYSKQIENEDWLAIISNLAWQAANFVKPDTKKGGSMDPAAYVKIKCVASGRPDQSALIKGVVCTKNIKHKRMTSQYKHPKLLLLGGSLEYQRATTELASINTLLEEEMNHLKVILSKIEAHRPNVLLVEKSVSPYAQECLLAKEISLVLNVKRHLLERISQCSGASITHVDRISAARLGHCELFRLERVSEELEVTNQSNKKPSKTLMFFEGCPRRLGCTILLRGLCRDELKKIKHAVQYAVFAAYHLSLETSFLADEGASLPMMALQPAPTKLEDANMDNLVTTVPTSGADLPSRPIFDVPIMNELSPGQSMEVGDLVSSVKLLHFASDVAPMDDRADDISDGCLDGQISIASVGSGPLTNPDGTSCYPSEASSLQTDTLEVAVPGERHSDEPEKTGEQVSNEYFSAADSHESILVSFTNYCVLKGTVCERSRLFRIKFYGSFDKPLGRYLCDDLFDPASYCQSCKEPVEAHVQCYTHQQGSLTINVRRLSSNKLPGQQDGKIWMWHRCLQCAHEDGVPPATRRVVMSDSAWGLSFGKFLELSFSNHATANRIANCGHSLQRDCLRFYGCGDMVAFFHYSPIDILSVHLPPSMLEFDGRTKREWLKREAAELKSKINMLYMEIAAVLKDMEQKSSSLCNGPSDCREHIVALKNLLSEEKNDYSVFLQQDTEDPSLVAQKEVDILKLNNLWHSLLITSHVWEYRFYSLDSLLRSSSSTSAVSQDASLHSKSSTDLSSKELKSDNERAESDSDMSKAESPKKNADLELNASEGSNVQSSSLLSHNVGGEISMSDDSSESEPSSASILSDKIDSAWTGMDQTSLKSISVNPISDDPHAVTSQVNLPCKRLMAPVRVYSFDSALRLRERLHKGSVPSSSLHLSPVRSFHSSSDYRSSNQDPISGILRTYSQIPPQETQRFSSILSTPLTYISGASHMPEGARLLLPQVGRNNLVIAVYDDEPTSIISYALSSKEHEDWVSNKSNDLEGSASLNDIGREELNAASISTWPSFGSMDLDYMSYGSYGSEDPAPRIGSLFYSSKKSPHLRVSFEDDSASAMGKAKFSVTCYFAKEFDMLRRKCCPNEVDFLSSLSRCKKWSAQGGKSNVYFAKSMDDRFIVKQVTKTELESFEEFAPQYFKYLTGSLNTGSPTCLAKVLGIYQVSVKNLKGGGKETKMDLMVMENLFFQRSISRIYDLKGSSRARYNSDTTGANKVLLDMNLLEALRTNPIFLGSKAKRTLERAVWNDTSFLASVDVMDYSLLVGVDEERKELVLGIIDFMRQYTWDKHLETWVKASGILGGPKNASPTIISPKQYKRRFRKAMTAYFLTVPEQWSSCKP